MSPTPNTAKAPTVFNAGFAQHVITPPIGTSLAGFFHDRVAKTVRDDLRVRAIVLREGATTIALVSLDLLCVDGDFVDEAKAVIAKETGIAPEAIMISATHTHTGPEVRRVGNKVPRNETWRAGLSTWIADTVIKAHADLTPVSLRVGHIKTDGYVHNRLFRLNDGTEQMGRWQNQDKLLGPAGPVDPDLQTLSFVDAAGNVRGMIVNFGMHGGPAVGGGDADFLSADWPGELSRHLGLLYGPEVVAMFLLGPCGDTWHHPYGDTLVPQSGPAAAIALGRGLAGAAACAAERAEPETGSQLAVLTRNVEVPYYTRTPEIMAEVADLKKRDHLDAPEAYFVQAVEEWPFDGKICSVPLQAIRIGELALVAIPAQIFTRIGMEMKQWSPARRTMVVELANTRVTSYVPTADQVERGAYGSRPIVSRWLSTDTGRRMIDAVLVMLQELW